MVESKTQPDPLTPTLGSFLHDVVEARRMWGERTSWQRDANGECRADRAWKGLLWSAAHEGMLLGKGPGGEWNDRKQTALEAAQSEYEMRTRLSLFMPNDKLRHGEKETYE